MEFFRTYTLTSGVSQVSPTAEVDDVLVAGVQLTDMAQEFELPLYWLSWVERS